MTSNITVVPGPGTQSALGNGASGNYQVAYDGSITNGSNSFTAASGGVVFSANSVGLNLTIQGAGASGVPLSATITGYTSPTTVTLAASASTTVTGAAYHVGSDDSGAINTQLGLSSVQEFVINPGYNFLSMGYITPQSGQNLVVKGNIIYAGQSTGQQIIGAQSAYHTYGGPRQNDITVDFQGGKLTYSPTMPNTSSVAGVEIWNTDGFAVKFPTIETSGMGYHVQSMNSTNGSIIGGRLTSQYPKCATAGTSPGQGDDGIHIYGQSQNIVVMGNQIVAGDDALSFTAEGTNSLNAVQKNIVATGNVTQNYGHSGYKITTANATGQASLLNYVLTSNIINQPTAGAPIILTNPGYPVGATVSDILIGDTIADAGLAAAADNTQLSNIDGLMMHDSKLFSGVGQIAFLQQMNRFGVRHVEIEQRIAPTITGGTIIAPLSLNSVTWIGGNSCVYAFASGTSLTNVVAGNYLVPQGCTNNVNNIPGLINAVGFSGTGSVSGTVFTLTTIVTGNVGIGAIITGTGITANTTITSLASGTMGATGSTYNVSQSSTATGTVTVTSANILYASNTGRRSSTANETGSTATALVYASQGSMLQLRDCIDGDLDITLRGNNPVPFVGTGSVSGSVLTITAVQSGALFPLSTIVLPAAAQGVALGLNPGTTILSQASGTTGGIGTYNLSASGTVSSTTITAPSNVIPFKGAGTISGNTLTLTAYQTGALMPGSVISGAGITGSSTVLALASGTLNAVGSTYTLSQTSSVASPVTIQANAPVGFVGTALNMDSTIGLTNKWINIKVKIIGQLAGTGVVLSNVSNCRLSVISMNSKGGALIQENVNTGSGYCEIIECTDMDALATGNNWTAGYGQVYRPPGTSAGSKHRNLHGNTTDHVVTQALISSGTSSTTITVDDTIYAESASNFAPVQVLARAQNGTPIGVTWSTGSPTMTLTAFGGNVSTSTIVDVEIRPAY